MMATKTAAKIATTTWWNLTFKTIWRRISSNTTFPIVMHTSSSCLYDNAGPALNQHWLNIYCSLGKQHQQHLVSAASDTSDEGEQDGSTGDRYHHGGGHQTRVVLIRRSGRWITIPLSTQTKWSSLWPQRHALPSGNQSKHCGHLTPLIRALEARDMVAYTYKVLPQHNKVLEY